MEMAGLMIARMFAPLVPTKVAMWRPGCSCSEEILPSKLVKVASRSAENIVTVAWWNFNSSNLLKLELVCTGQGKKTVDKESTQDWDIRLTYSHVMRLCFNFFLKNFPNPQPPAASSASFHRDERVFEA